MAALIDWWRRDLSAVAPCADGAAASAVGSDLLRRWDEPHRRYHTAQHLVEMFGALGELEEADEITARDGALARLAAWFHDAVYLVANGLSGDAGSGETASTALARAALGRLGLASADVATIARLVADTTAHQVSETGGLRAAFQDADLWVLAAEPARFDAYCAQVREEYAAWPDAAYRAGRRAVLEPFLTRPHVYATAHARARWEPQACANLPRELARLEASGRTMP